MATLSTSRERCVVPIFLRWNKYKYIYPTEELVRGTNKRAGGKKDRYEFTWSFEPFVEFVPYESFGLKRLGGWEGYRTTT